MKFYFFMTYFILYQEYVFKFNLRTLMLGDFNSHNE